MSNNYEQKITELKNSLEKAKNMKFRAEAKLEQLTKSQEELISEIRAMGLEPENIDSEIENLKNEIENLINQANQMLPADI